MSLLHTVLQRSQLVFRTVIWRRTETEQYVLYYYICITLRLCVVLKWTKVSFRQCASSTWFIPLCICLVCVCVCARMRWVFSGLVRLTDYSQNWVALFEAERLKAQREPQIKWRASTITSNVLNNLVSLVPLSRRQMEHYWLMGCSK